MPQSTPAGLAREHVLRTLSNLAAGIDYRFGEEQRSHIDRGRQRSPAGRPGATGGNVEGVREQSGTMSESIGAVS